VNPFTRLTVDGTTLEGDALRHWADALVARHDDDPEGAQALRATVLELMRGEGLEATTSGTTGPPKRITLPVEDLVASAELTGRVFGLVAGDRVLHCLPGAFVAGKLMLVRAFVLGLDLHVISARGSVLEKLDRQDRFRFAAMVPLQLARALDEDRARVEDQFHTVLLGGGPVSEALERRLSDLRTEVFLGYGSTETVTHVAVRRLNGPNASPVFTAVGDCHFARDPRGCLVIYTPHLSTFQQVTNDLVELVDDTHFRWMGRHDNVILSGGRKVHPEQLEARTAALIDEPHYFSGTPDALLGQAVVLTIETDRPQQEVVPAVMARLLHVLHPHEMPRHIRTLPRLERTVSGKIRR
jgi:O-succinylbenzoic acid--CoA ligase